MLRHFVPLIVASSLVHAALHPVVLADESRVAKSDLENRVAQLIEELGAEEYTTRERAQEALSRLGLDAYDALMDAQHHPDLEVANRARYLAGSIRVKWIQEYDSSEVKRILRDYEDQAAAERIERMERLAQLDDWTGTEALVRLSRFENVTVLSKTAAVKVLKQPFPDDLKTRKSLVEKIRRGIGISDRVAATWINAFADYLLAPDKPSESWRELITSEIELLRAAPDETTFGIVHDLLRWRYESLTRAGLSEEAAAVLRGSGKLRSGAPDDVLRLLAWLESVEAWGVIDDLATTNRKRFERDSRLMYRWAEAQLRQGLSEVANQTAAQAFQLPSEDRLLVAEQLRHRGLFPWSIREFRQIFQNEPEGDEASVTARIALSELLHDRLRDLEAAETLRPLADRLESDDAFRRRFAERNRSPAPILSRMHFFYAEHHRLAGNRAKQIENMKLGIGQDPTDADLLIAMYRLEEMDDTWRTSTQELIAEAVESFRGTIRERRDLLKQMDQMDGGDRFLPEIQKALASALNQLAWLVANTEGDYQEALENSLESVRLKPNDGGLLDTLARCYYSVGDLEKAAKHQAEALSLEPHSGQLQRQLKFFQDAMRASNPPNAGSDR